MKALAWFLGISFSLGIIVSVASNLSPSTMTPGRGGAGTDADQLIKNCGTPLKDDSTAYDSPRPPIVTRFIDYKVNGVRLKFIYVPGNGHAGDPPPYDWKLQMVANAKTNKLYDRDQMSKLMSCSASLPGPRLVPGQSPGN